MTLKSQSFEPLRRLSARQHAAWYEVRTKTHLTLTVLSRAVTKPSHAATQLGGHRAQLLGLCAAEATRSIAPQRAAIEGGRSMEN